MDETTANIIRLNLLDEVLNSINVEDCTTAEETRGIVHGKELVKQVIFKGVVQSAQMRYNI